MTTPEYVPATRVEPDPEDGWAAAELSEDEYVDDEFIQTCAARTYAPLMPEDEKLFPVEGGNSA